MKPLTKPRAAALIALTVVVAATALANPPVFIKRGTAGIVPYHRTYSDFTTPPRWTIIYVNRRGAEIVRATSLQPGGWSVRRDAQYCRVFVPRGSDINHPRFNHYLVRAKLPGARFGYGEGVFYVQ